MRLSSQMSFEWLRNCEPCLSLFTPGRNYSTQHKLHIAPFNNMRTLKFKAQPTNAFFATVNQIFGGSSQLPTTAEGAGAFCLRMREMRHLIFLNALRLVFKRVIYVVRKILSREMKD